VARSPHCLAVLSEGRTSWAAAAALISSHDGEEGWTPDAAPVGEGISELRIHCGAGYRIYFHRQGNTVVILLCGGDKGSQAKDITTAKRLLDEWMK
jgi:putative addiction module killer protein